MPTRTCPKCGRAILGPDSSVCPACGSVAAEAERASTHSAGTNPVINAMERWTAALARRLSPFAALAERASTRTAGTNPVVNAVERWISALGRRLSPFAVLVGQFLTLLDTFINWFLRLLSPRPEDVSPGPIGISVNSLSEEEAEKMGLILYENRWITPDERAIPDRMKTATNLVRFFGLCCVLMSGFLVCLIIAFDESVPTALRDPRLFASIVPFIAGVGLLRCRTWAWSLFMVILVYLLLMCLEDLLWASFLGNGLRIVSAVGNLFIYMYIPAMILFSPMALRVLHVSRKRILISILVGVVGGIVGYTAFYDKDSKLLDACREGYVRKAEFQLNRGANVKTSGRFKDTLLQEAVFCDHPAIVRLLLRHGADPDARDSHGDTALGVAVACGKIEVAKALLNGGADPNAMGIAGWRPLNWSVAEGKMLLVKALLEKGADINGKNKEGSTPLMVAGACNQVEAARLLLQEGADFDARNQHGETALELASNAGNEEMVTLLREYGAKE